MKKFIIGSIVTAIVALFIVGACSLPRTVELFPPAPVTVSNELDAFISNAILEKNMSMYRQGEAQAEGHVVLGTAQSGNELQIYCVVSYNELGFENGILTCVSGSWEIPVRIIFSTTGGEYKLIEYREAMDGSLYPVSVKEMFPKNLHGVLSSSGSYAGKMNEQLNGYAERYLDTLGRSADIHLSYVQKERIPMDVSLSNRLLSEYSEYPLRIGSREVLDNGVRIIYQCSYDEENGHIIFEKGVMDDNFEVASIEERTVIDLATGETV